jgi:hypothetical protein
MPTFQKDQNILAAKKLIVLGDGIYFATNPPAVGYIHTEVEN